MEYMNGRVKTTQHPINPTKAPINAFTNIRRRIRGCFYN
jgi:hypothetical protein